MTADAVWFVVYQLMLLVGLVATVQLGLGILRRV